MDTLTRSDKIICGNWKELALFTIWIHWNKQNIKQAIPFNMYLFSVVFETTERRIGFVSETLKSGVAIYGCILKFSTINSDMFLNKSIVIFSLQNFQQFGSKPLRKVFKECVLVLCYERMPKIKWWNILSFSRLE